MISECYMIQFLSVHLSYSRLFYVSNYIVRTIKYVRRVTNVESLRYQVTSVIQFAYSKKFFAESVDYKRQDGT